MISALKKVTFGGEVIEDKGSTLDRGDRTRTRWVGSGVRMLASSMGHFFSDGTEERKSFNVFFFIRENLAFYITCWTSCNIHPLVFGLVELYK